MIDTIVGLNFIVFLFFLSKEIGWKLGLLSSILISWLLFLILRLLNYTWKPIVTILVLVLVVSIIKAIFKMIKNNNNKSQPTNNNKKYNENNKQNILGTKEKHINNQRLDFGTEGKLNKQVQDFLEKKEKQKNTRKWNDINLKENKNSNTINMKNTIKKELKKVETIATSKAVLPWIEKFIIRTTKDFDNEDIPTEDYMKKLDDLIKFLRYKDFVKSDDVLDIMYLNLIIEKMKNSIYLNYMKINLKIKEDEGKNQIISKYISCHGNKSYKINNLKILTQILKQDIENTKKEVVLSPLFWTKTH